MRILCVDVGFSAFSGGSSQRNYQMARHLLDAGEDVRMLITDKWLRRGGSANGFPFPSERLSILPLINERYHVPLLRPRVIDEAVEFADVIHVDYLSAMSPAVCAAARRQRKKWVICPAGTLPFRGRSLRLKRAFHRLWGRRMLRDAVRVIAITDDERERLAAYVPERERIVVVPNAVDAPPPRAHPPPARPHVLYLSRFEASKGPLLLIEAFARVPPATRGEHVLIMAGDDSPDRRAAQHLADRLGIRDSVRFIGWITGPDKEAVLATASFVVIPSISDAMTITVLDAAAAGKPVLITRGCGFPTVESAGAGRVVEATVESLAAGLQWMFDAREQWPGMGRHAEALAARYSWAVVTHIYRRVFREVLEERRPY